jgi:hypothetical protein
MGKLLISNDKMIEKIKGNYKNLTTINEETRNIVLNSGYK